MWYYWVGGLIAVIVIALMVYDLLKYKHTFIARVRTKNKSYILRTKAKEIQQDGQLMWKLLKKSLVPVTKGIIPSPTDAADIDNKGRMWAEAEVTDGAQVTYLTTDRKNTNFDPIPREERVSFLNQLKKAQADKPMDRFGQILQLAPIAIMALVIIVALVFAGDIIGAYTDMHVTTTKSVQGVMNQAERIMTKIDQLENDVQFIDDEEKTLKKENEND